MPFDQVISKVLTILYIADFFLLIYRKALKEFEEPLEEAHQQ